MPTLPGSKAALDDNRDSIGDIRRFEQSDVAFHFAIATVPKNPIYTTLHSAIVEWLVDQRHVTLELSRPEQDCLRGPCGDLSRRLPTAIPMRAAREMREHLEQVSDLYWKVREATR